MSIDDSKVLWIIDGVPRPTRGWNGKDSLKTEDIASVNVFKGGDAIRYFGDRGANGVIAVITKSPVTEAFSDF